MIDRRSHAWARRSTGRSESSYGRIQLNRLLLERIFTNNTHSRALPGYSADSDLRVGAGEVGGEELAVEVVAAG